MGAEGLQIAGGPLRFQHELAEALASAPPLKLRTLVNAGLAPDLAAPDLAATVQRCQDFAAALPEGDEALIVTILHATAITQARDSRNRLSRSMQAAGLWAFTRHAALDWAPRRIRVNVIGLGTSPTLPTEGPEQGGRAAAAVPAAPASIADIARTIRAMAGFASMTGQIIRLGTEGQA